MKLEKTTIAVAIANLFALPTAGMGGWQDTLKGLGDLAG